MDEMPESGDCQPEEKDKQFCLNCREVLNGRFCSSCGQDSRPFQRSLGSIMSGAAEGLFDFDGKILKSIVPLLTSPGKLTLSFLEGKRRAQVNPFQLYAFFSFLFFLTAFSGPNEDSVAGAGYSTGAESDTNRFSVQVQKVCQQILKENGSRSLVFHYDSLQGQLPAPQRDQGILRYFRRTMHAFGDQLIKDEHVVEELFANMKANIPNSMILLLPFFALILKLLYIRRPFFYIDHLVFSIHLFCFFFIAGMIYWFLDWLWPDTFLEVFLCIMPIYPILAMRRIFRQSWRKTTLKFFIAVFGFSFIAITALTVNFFITIFFQL